MIVKALTHDFKLCAVIDTISTLSYTEDFQEAGELSMTLPFKKELYQILKPPCRLLIEDLIFNVDKIHASESEIRVHGSGIFKEFEQFYISMPEEQNASPAQILYSMASRASFEGISYGVYGLAVPDERVCEIYEWCRDLYGIMTQLCFDYDLGLRMVYDFNGGELRFHILDVRDRATNSATTYTTISDSRESYAQIESVCDISNYKSFVELIYKINSLDELVSYTFNRCPGDESPRRYIEYPHLLPAGDNELYSMFNTRANQIFKERRKKQYYRVTLLGEPLHRVGDLCYVESSALGEHEWALLTRREVSLIDAHRTEALILEVRK